MQSRIGWIRHLISKLLRVSNLPLIYLATDETAWELLNASKVSKQELYFVKQNYEIFSTEISAREKLRQKNVGPHKGVIGSKIGRPSGSGPSVGEFL